MDFSGRLWTFNNLIPVRSEMVEAEAKVRMGMAAAFRSGNLGFMTKSR